MKQYIISLSFPISGERMWRCKVFYCSDSHRKEWLRVRYYFLREQPQGGGVWEVGFGWLCGVVFRSRDGHKKIR